ncbi:MAG: hypothetical protein KA144_13240 [Xanthomonadaceae bacterium]|nr:hypothetical protein [Xanthomonadaceae bacterium]
MKSGRSFFIQGEAADSTYRLLRDDATEHIVEWHDYVESLWKRYDGNQDANFLGRAKAAFLPCFWEMYLWVSLEEHGYNLARVGPSGSEFYIRLGDRRFWVEAICPNRGEGADAIPVFPPHPMKVRDVPVESIMLRYAATVRRKVAKFIGKDIPAGRATQEDGFLLAISSAALPLDARFGGELPYIVKAAYGLGALTLPLNRITGTFGDAFYSAKEFCRKSNEVEVSMGFLQGGQYPCLSGIIHSSVNFTNTQLSLGADFELLSNAAAIIPLPTEAFRAFRRWRVQDESLLRQESMT